MKNVMCSNLSIRPFNRHKLVVHAVHQQYGDGQLGVVHLIPLGPVLTAHHRSQNERRHVKSVSLFQKLLLFSALSGETSSEHKTEETQFEHATG